MFFVLWAPEDWASVDDRRLLFFVDFFKNIFVTPIGRRIDSFDRSILRLFGRIHSPIRNL